MIKLLYKLQQFTNNLDFSIKSGKFICYRIYNNNKSFQMDININTPALLFPAVSLILLAYTNRFLAIASLVRNLGKEYQTSHNHNIIKQIHSLKRRLEMIRYMQAFGVLSLLTAIFCMFLLFVELAIVAKYIFGLSLLLLMISLSFSIREIMVSINALNLVLTDIYSEKHK
jgi:hypothetical protein